MSEGGFPQLQQKIANLNAAQRVGIVAAVALSSFAVYATKKHKSICGGPVDSPRHRDACPLNFLTCAPSNDINESIATMQDTLVSAASAANESIHNIAQSANTAMADFDMDPSHWNLPKLPDLPNVTVAGLPEIRRRLEPLLGCPHDEGFSNHPHSQTCLPCNDLHRASNALDRAYMDWSAKSPPSPPEDEASTSNSPLQRPEQPLRCPHNLKLSPHAAPCSSCAERSYTGAVERGRMWNWTSTSTATPSPGSPASSGSASSSMSSFKSMLGDLASQVPVLRDASRMLDAASARVASRVSDDIAAKGPVGALPGRLGGAGGPFAGGAAGVGKTALYFIFWYLCTLCNDQFRIKNKGSLLARFPAPHLLQAFGFLFQAYFVHEVQKHEFKLLPTPTNHLTWTSNMNIVVPIAIAASFDIALELNQGGVDDQFNKLCKSGSPLLILILTYALKFEIPTFKLTTSIASITTGSLLTIAKALDYNYEMPDVLALMMGAFMAALRWTGAQYLLQKEDKGSSIITMGRMAPWMTICTLAFSIVFEKSWLMITRIDYFFESPIDMFEGFGQLLIFYVLWTLEILADFLLITNTGAVTFIVVKTLKNVGDLGTKIFKKGFYHEERRWIERKKTMNEETIGLHYIGLGLVLFLWHRYQNWAQNRGGGGGGSGSGGGSGGVGGSRRNSNSSSGGGGGGGGRRNSNSNYGSGGDGGIVRTMSRTRGRAWSSSGGGGVCGRTGGGGGACGRADCGGESCGRSGGGGAECSTESCARPGAGDASQRALPRDLLADRQCFHDIF